MAHILTFEEIYKERIWGGRNLEKVLGKKIPANVPIGESWELADLPLDKSVVSSGPMAGKNIAELVEIWGTKLLGEAKLDAGQFPLLIKILDANDILSVQVHPDYDAAAQMGGNVRAKYEGWYVVEADEDAYVYIGFKPDTTPDMVLDAIDRGTLASLLVKYPARKGDFFYLPGGTVHALGAGLLVAEIQTPSDTTFRLYDWKRVDAKTGKPRELHITQGMNCIRYEQEAEKPDGFDEKDSQSQLLAFGPTFTIVKSIRKQGQRLTVKTGQAAAWIVIEGKGTIRDAQVQVDLKPGRTLLIPADAKDVVAEFSEECICLEARLVK
jgi:mannose-6-phosphate isomerase